MSIFTFLVTMKFDHRIFSIVLVAVFILAGCSNQHHIYTLATGANGGTYKSVGNELAKVIQSENTKFKVLSGDEYSAVQNCKGLVDHTIDFALAQNDVSVDSFINRDSPTHASDLRTVLPIFPDILFIIYKDSLKPKSLKDLMVGRKVSLGPRESGTTLFVQRVLRDFGIDTSEYISIYTSLQNNIISDTVPICCFISGFNIPKISDMLLHKHGKIFSLDDFELANKGSSVDGFCMNYQRARPFIIPKNTYGNIPDAPVLTLAIDAVLLTRKDVDEYVVHDVVKSILEQRQVLQNRNTLFGALSEHFELGALNFPLHDGTEMYLERNEPTFLKKNSDILGLFLSVVVAFVGAVSSFTKWNHRRKKNRIDEYYLELTMIGKNVHDYTTIEECQQAIERINQLQNTAFEQLVQEKLSADESFNIFLTLVNNTVNAIEKKILILNNGGHPV